MIHTDKLARLFHIIEASINTHKSERTINYIRLYEDIIKVLIKEGVLRNYKINYNNTLTIFFPIRSEILKIERISKPSRRVFQNSNEIEKERYKYPNIFLISTSKGIMTNQEAFLNKIGGEVLCKITYKKCLI